MPKTTKIRQDPASPQSKIEPRNVEALTDQGRSSLGFAVLPLRKRPTLQALMQDIEDGKIDLIAIDKVDRLPLSGKRAPPVDKSMQCSGRRQSEAEGSFLNTIEDADHMSGNPCDPLTTTTKQSR